jgi:hypothetical protein
MTEVNTLVHDLLARERRIAIIWQTDDVLEVRPDLTEDQAWEVLQLAEADHDANHGICWETLVITAESLFPEPEAPDGDETDESEPTLSPTKGLDA